MRRQALNGPSGTRARRSTAAVEVAEAMQAAAARAPVGVPVARAEELAAPAEEEARWVDLVVEVGVEV